MSVREWKMFQLSTICQRGFGTKIMFFTYGFTTFIGKKFIDACSLGFRQMAAKLYRSAERNKDYKAILAAKLYRSAVWQGGYKNAPATPASCSCHTRPAEDILPTVSLCSQPLPGPGRYEIF